MKMNKLTNLLLAATLGLASGAATRVKTWRPTTSITARSTPVPLIPAAQCSTLTARP